jgi:hypothetical protein
MSIFFSLFVWPPNFINYNRANGEIVRVYEDILYVHIKGRGSANTNALYIVFKDSSVFFTVDKKTITELKDVRYVGKQAELLFYNQQKGRKGITKLVIDNVVIQDEDKCFVLIFLICVLWVIIGGIAEVIRIWKNTQVPFAKSTQIIQPEKPIKNAEISFHRYSNCPACGFKLKETDNECPDCGLNLS